MQGQAKKNNQYQSKGFEGSEIFKALNEHNFLRGNFFPEYVDIKKNGFIFNQMHKIITLRAFCQATPGRKAALDFVRRTQPGKMSENPWRFGVVILFEMLGCGALGKYVSLNYQFT